MSAPRIIGRPEPGYWLIRLVRNGPPVPAAIMWAQTTHDPVTGEPMDRSRFLVAVIGGKPAGLEDVWHRRGRPIDEAEYRFRLADAAWAREHAPSDAHANPTRSINPLVAPLPF